MACTQHVVRLPVTLQHQNSQHGSTFSGGPSGFDYYATGAFHGSELPFVFDLDLPLTSDETDLSKAMELYWASFATHHAPGESGKSAEWPLYDHNSDVNINLVTPASDIYASEVNLVTSGLGCGWFVACVRLCSGVTRDRKLLAGASLAAASNIGNAVVLCWDAMRVCVRTQRATRASSPTSATSGTTQRWRIGPSSVTSNHAQPRCCTAPTPCTVGSWYVTQWLCSEHNPTAQRQTRQTAIFQMCIS